MTSRSGVIKARAYCVHAFYRECLQEFLEQAPQLPSDRVGCPTCFAPMTWAEGQEEINQDEEQNRPAKQAQITNRQTLAATEEQRDVYRSALEAQRCHSRWLPWVNHPLSRFHAPLFVSEATKMSAQ
ncbi:unnamed protein product [Symbiodinium pilosum]|uniref:RING-type domain-containing protein n=1 Tax=Symbiodinium pilosum TaxID=2952 RepID=A0A812WIC7_SYMPI|nr:unnamed protein product [Symbiodinium pilosum]